MNSQQLQQEIDECIETVTRANNYNQMMIEQALFIKSRSHKKFNLYGLSNQIESIYNDKRLSVPRVCMETKQNQPINLKRAVTQSNVVA